MIDNQEDVLKNTYIIGLNKPTEKIKYLEKFGINAKWFKGINGKSTSQKIINKYISTCTNNTLSPSSIGCAISHMLLWEKIVKNKKKYTMIFEDDVVLNKKFNKYFYKCLNNAPNDFDILFLGAATAYKVSLGTILMSFYYKTLPKSPTNVNKYIKKPANFLCFHAYILSYRGAKKLLKFSKKLLTSPIDSHIYKMFLQKKINVYIMYPELAYQSSTLNLKESNILNKNTFPSITNELFSNILIDKYVSLNYGLNLPLFRIKKPRNRHSFNYVFYNWIYTFMF